MLLVQHNGQLCIWDILRCQYEPVLTVQVCDEPLVSVRAHESVSIYSLLQFVPTAAVHHTNMDAFITFFYYFIL